MKEDQIVNLPELAPEEKTYFQSISIKYEVPFDELEFYLKNIRYLIKRVFGSMDLIGNIDFYGKRSTKESIIVKAISQVVLAILYDWHQLGNYKKCIVAALILKFYKLDKYDPIMTEEKFQKDPADSAPNYNRYLYDRMRSRFKTIRNQKKRSSLYN
ncbi:MAG: hypothetical protein ACMUHX_10425 [bacterium]